MEEIKKPKLSTFIKKKKKKRILWAPVILGENCFLFFSMKPPTMCYNCTLTCVPIVKKIVIPDI